MNEYRPPKTAAPWAKGLKGRPGPVVPPKKRPPSDRVRRQRRRFLAITAVAIAMIALILATARNDPPMEGEALIRIPPGTSTVQIARLLKEDAVIKSEKEFLGKAESLGVSDTLKAGLYRFRRGEPLEAILSKLDQGIQAPEGVFTIPEGYSLSEIAAGLAAKTGITREQYQQAASAGGKQLPLAGAAAAANLEGFLFPSTYDLDPDLTAKLLVDRQLKAFTRETAALPWQNADTLGLTPYQILIVASMVEREAKVPEERPLVAAVIYNRLRVGMKLEVDATVQYAVGHWKRELTQQDLDTDSPYNTRLYAGLPPGPICNPGTASIRAALESAAVDYIFYVATGDEAGHHFFTASYEDFLRVKEGHQ